MKLYSSLFLTSLCLPGALSRFLGPVYPPPRDLTSSDSLVAAAWKNVTRQLEQFAHVNGTSGLNDLTFSQVDGDSIYRIASVSKLFTVFAGKIELSLEDWETPLSKIFPEFAAFMREKSDDTLDPVYDTQWDEITPFALASQMAGIAQDASPAYSDWITLAAFGYAEPGQVEAKWGFPPVDRSDPAVWAPCSTLEGFEGKCSLENYTLGAATNPPVALPWTVPEYSNNAFTLLGQAIANLTGKSIDDVYQDSIFDPLDMASSYSVVPPKSEYSRSVFAGNEESGFTTDNGLTKSSGGIYSTLNDMAKFSTGLLNSTLLSPHETNRWMKPVTHTSDLHYAIGAPWEIYRYEDPKTGHVTDIYTKLGDSGNYGAIALFIPDYDAGFNVIAASTSVLRDAKMKLVIQGVIDAILPALTQQGAKELACKYAGTYVSTNKSLNSSITFVPSKNGTQGLRISSFVSNGTDITSSLNSAGGFIESDPYALRPVIRTPGKIAFRPATVPKSPVLPRNPSNLFTSFYDADQFPYLGKLTYASQLVNEFVFELGENGEVVAVTPSAWRVRLEKK
ncbi:beta-lactamase/transpeptidase-like protein [Aspergillus unguis]